MPYCARQDQTVRDDASNQRIDYGPQVQGIRNLKGYRNCTTGPVVTDNLLNMWILPIGEVAYGRVCVCSLLAACIAGLFYNISKELEIIG